MMVSWVTLNKHKFFWPNIERQSHHLQYIVDFLILRANSAVMYINSALFFSYDFTKKRTKRCVWKRQHLPAPGTCK